MPEAAVVDPAVAAVAATAAAAATTAAADAGTKDGTVAPPADSAATTAAPDKAAADAAKTKPVDGPPETYTVALPEGFKDLDKPLLDQFTPIGKELGLTQAQADKLIGLHAESLKAHVAAQDAAWKSTTAKWAEDLKADPILGGAQMQATLDASQAALKKFGDEKLVSFIEAFQLGNQPDFVRMMVKVGKAIGEDKLVVPPSAGGGSAVRPTDGQVFYPAKTQ